MIRFELSNGQKKALLIRAQPLRIALPAPAIAPENWLLWARESLWEHGRLITGVIQDHIDVCSPSGQGMSGVIGRIVRQDETPVLTWGVDVIICNVDPPVKARHPREVVQWPGRAFNVETGQEWPSVETFAPASPGGVPA